MLLFTLTKWNPLSLFFLILVAALTHLSANEEFSRAFLALSEGKIEEAKILFYTFHSDPDIAIQALGNLGLAKIFIEEERYLEAEDLLKNQEAEKLIPAALKYEWLYTYGDLHFRQNHFDLSIHWLEKALPKRNEDNAPWRDQTLLLLARSHLKRGERDKAENYYQQIKDKSPLVIAQIHLEKEEINEEIEQIFQAHALPIEKTYIQAELLARKGKRKEALTLLEQEDFLPPLHEKQLFLEGTLHYEEKNYKEAVSYFQKLLELYPNSPLAPLALYWGGRADESEKKRYFKQLFENYPEHSLADEAYFLYFSPQEYLLGNRLAIKHLHDFKNKFPLSPLLLHAYYLEGLDALHDRRSPEGKWLSRQNLTEAIDAFQKVETLFDKFHQKRSDLLSLKHQAILERAKTNFKVAKTAKLAKKTIYLDYAKNVFHSLIASLTDKNPLLEEALYYLSLTELESNDQENALKTLEKLLSSYEKQEIKEGYYLASGLYLKGLILGNDTSLYDRALLSGAPYLSNDEVLTILIAKAETFRKTGALDAAMLQLSEVANYNTASSLRLKALFLRAEIYREQGRNSLAQKQLESIALKGGEWALKAKEQLDKYYGFE